MKRHFNAVEYYQSKDIYLVRECSYLFLFVFREYFERCACIKKCFLFIVEVSFKQVRTTAEKYKKEYEQIEKDRKFRKQYENSTKTDRTRVEKEDAPASCYSMAKDNVAYFQFFSQSSISRSSIFDLRYSIFDIFEFCTDPRVAVVSLHCIVQI